MKMWSSTSFFVLLRLMFTSIIFVSSLALRVSAKYGYLVITEKGVVK